MLADALLLWLMTVVGLFAAVGFLVVIVRGALDRRWTTWSVLRFATVAAVVLSLPAWLLLLDPV